MRGIEGILWVPGVIAMKDKFDFKSFNALTDDASRLQVVFAKITQLKLGFPKSEPKCMEKTKDHTRKAGQYAKMENYEDAFPEINKALSCVPQNDPHGEKIVNQLLNLRIIMFMEMKKYRHALEDILVLREKPGADLNDLTTKELQVLVKLSSLSERAQLEEHTWKSRNSQYPALSHKVTVRHDSQKGRHLVAVEDIAAGEIIGVESPFAAYINAPEICAHCGVCNENVSYFCSECPVEFCSMTCLDKAKSYHTYECGLRPDVATTMGVALRLITQRSLQQVIDDERKVRYDENTKNDGVYKPDDYYNVHRLIQHDVPELTFELTLTAAMMLQFLRDTKYLPQHGKASLSKKELLVGKLLMKYLVIERFNGYSILKTRVSAIGTAIYPTLALINYSCDPTVRGYHVKKNLVLRNMRPISAGEEVTISYALHRNYSSTDKVIRTSLNRFYKFECECRACVENWPTVFEQANFTMRLKCKCGVTIDFESEAYARRCPQCKNKNYVRAAINKLSELADTESLAESMQAFGNSDEARNQLLPAINDIFKYFAMPCPTRVAMAQHLLWETFAKDTKKYDRY